MSRCQVWLRVFRPRWSQQHFADLERQQFGRDEFGAMVARAGRIEHNLGICDLGQFTPEIGPFLPGS